MTLNRLDRNRNLLKIVRILIATVYLRARNESLKSCIILPVRWSVKQFFAPNSPIFGIRLPKKQEEKEEEHRQLQSVMCFTQTQHIICLNYYVFVACLQWLIVRFPYRFLANFSLKNVKMKLDSKWFKRKNIVLIFRNSFVLCRNLKPVCIHLKIKIQFEALQHFCELQIFFDPA